MSNCSIIDYFVKKQRPLILDGAMGSFLELSNYTIDKVLWSSILNIYKPDIIRDIHKKYLDAGAEIITTNTFRTNPAAIEASNYDIEISKFVNDSVKLAKNSIEQEVAFIAGTNAPAEDCYQRERTLSSKKLDYNHKKHIELLYESGTDFILNETQSHFDEIKIICEFCYINKIPFIISLFSEDGNTILSGQPLNEVIEYTINFNPLAISINCVSKNIFEKIDPILYNAYMHGFYLNLGTKNRKGKFTHLILPNEYKKIVNNYITKNTLFIGACCGSDPEHIRQIKELVNEIY